MIINISADIPDPLIPNLGFPDVDTFDPIKFIFNKRLEKCSCMDGANTFM